VRYLLIFSLLTLGCKREFSESERLSFVEKGRQLCSCNGGLWYVNFSSFPDDGPFIKCSDGATFFNTKNIVVEKQCKE